MVEYPKQDNTFIPVRGAMGIISLGINRYTISDIYPNGPSGWIIDDPLDVQPRVIRIFLKKGQGFDYLFFEDLV